MKQVTEQLDLVDQMTERYEAYLGSVILEDDELLAAIEQAEDDATRLAAAHAALAVVQERIRAYMPAFVTRLMPAVELVFAEQDDTAGLATAAKAHADALFMLHPADPMCKTYYQFAKHRFAELQDTAALIATLRNLVTVSSEAGVYQRQLPEKRYVVELSVALREAGAPDADLYEAGLEIYNVGNLAGLIGPTEGIGPDMDLQQCAFDAIEAIGEAFTSENVDRLDATIVQLAPSGPTLVLLAALAVKAAAAASLPDPTTARDAAAAAVHVADELGLTDIKLEGQIGVAHAMLELGDSVGARELLERVSAAYAALGFTMVAYHVLADAYRAAFEAGDLPAAAAYAAQTKALAGPFMPLYRYASLLMSDAHIAAASGNKDETIAALRELHFYATASGVEELRLEALTVIAGVLREVGEEAAATKLVAEFDED